MKYAVKIENGRPREVHLMVKTHVPAMPENGKVESWNENTACVEFGEDIIVCYDNVDWQITDAIPDGLELCDRCQHILDLEKAKLDAWNRGAKI
jgi:hypothetical protein